MRLYTLRQSLIMHAPLTPFAPARRHSLTLLHALPVSACHSFLCLRVVTLFAPHHHRVQIATCIKDGTKYAVKIIKKSEGKEGLLMQLQSESSRVNDDAGAVMC